jgi:hypothetical protein
VSVERWLGNDNPDSDRTDLYIKNKTYIVKKHLDTFLTKQKKVQSVSDMSNKRLFAITQP